MLNHIFNVSKISDRMEKPPKSQRLHHFFNGKNVLTDEEKVEVIEIIESNSKEVIDAIKSR